MRLPSGDQARSSIALLPELYRVICVARLTVSPAAAADACITKTFFSPRPALVKSLTKATLVPSGDQIGFSSKLVAPLSVRLVTAPGLAGSSRQMSRSHL